jgi:hypothetical protein
VLGAIEPGLLQEPQTPFVALHAALALAADGDASRLAELEHRMRQSSGAMRTVVAPLCTALGSSLEQRWAEAATTLEEIVPALPRVGGSAAQREVVEETLLFALVQAGEGERALAVLDKRLGRRPSLLDLRRRDSVRAHEQQVPA